MADIVTKLLASPAGSDALEFVMSDETPDRVGDVIEAKGWRLENFRANPIALFGHDRSFIVGHWSDVRVVGKQLIGKLNLLPAGISQRLDEIRAVVLAGVLRAVSVGLKPFDAEPIKGGRGIRFKAQELVECSLVSVPMNPNALAIAKSLNLSDDVRSMIFGKSADEITAAERLSTAGKPAVIPPNPRTIKMATLSERIEAAQTEVTQLRDQLNEQISKGDEIDATVTDEISSQIEIKEGTLASLRRAEKAIGTKADPVERKDEKQRRTYAAPAKKSEPKDLIIRSAVVQLLAHIEKRPILDVLNGRYGEDDHVKLMLDITTKAASAPATTTTSGWAAELVQTATLDLIESLVANSIYPILREIGGKYTFGRNGIASLPARSSGASVAGSFVGQGAPIPVRQAAFTASQLTPKKMGVITTFTREIAQKSTPDIEMVLRQAIQEDTGVAIDTVLLDANAATAIRPAGLRNGVTGITATAGGGFAALVADLKALVGALITSSGGNLRRPVWVMNPVQALAISLTQNAGGDFPFAADMKNGILLGYPVAQSATVPNGTVLLVDAADFFTATGDEPVFDVSDQATLHMEDTTPLAISATGTPNTVAAPIRSLFQTDSIALRMILDMNWSMRRVGMVAFVTTVSW